MDRKSTMVWYQNHRAYMVEATGLEPAASCSQSKRATKLRHASMLLSLPFGIISQTHFFVNCLLTSSCFLHQSAL